MGPVTSLNTSTLSILVSVDVQPIGSLSLKAVVAAILDSVSCEDSQNRLRVSGNRLIQASFVY